MDRNRVKPIPAIQVNAGEWYKLPGFDSYLCHYQTATWADKHLIQVNKRESRPPYKPGVYDDVFMYVEFEEEPDEKGRPTLLVDGETLLEHCPQAYDELVDLLLEVGFRYGLIWLTTTDSTQR
jgi:hypothetical protein